MFVFFHAVLMWREKTGTLKPRSPDMQMSVSLVAAADLRNEEEEKVHISVSLCSQILPAPLCFLAQLFVAFVSHCHNQSKMGIFV